MLESFLVTNNEKTNYELKYWVAFNRISGIGRGCFKAMGAHFGTLSETWRAGLTELRAAGLDTGAAQNIATRKLQIDLDVEMETLIGSEPRAITWHDDEYPERLKEIYDLPSVLYLRGELLPQDARSILLVGTRAPTAYGREAAYELTLDIASAGVVIVSGLARGVDAIAHRAALEAGQRTIAVMGSGIDVIYPREHEWLTSDILENGVVMSEYPVGTRPVAKNFSRRNRIMAA